jgi:hypothetical protein
VGARAKRSPEAAGPQTQVLDASGDGEDLVSRRGSAWTASSGRIRRLLPPCLGTRAGAADGRAIQCEAARVELTGYYRFALIGHAVA